MTTPVNDRVEHWTRRRFLSLLADAAKGSVIVLGMPAILSACQPGRESADTQTDSSEYTLLSAALALELDAATARIVPSDDTPGAREAGTVRFIDTVLADGRQEQLPILQAGVDDLNRLASERFGTPLFSSLNEAQQDELLQEVETSPFFSTLRYLTVASLFALPQYGGNGPDTGYSLIGMTHAHAYVPPFGYYDADYAARGE